MDSSINKCPRINASGKLTVDSQLHKCARIFASTISLYSFDIECYAWQTLHPMPEEYSRPWAHNSVRELNGLIYVGCGPCLESLYVYDPIGDTWMQLTSPSTTIDNPLMFKWKRVLYVADNRLLHRYDPGENSWTSVIKLGAVKFTSNIFKLLFFSILD